MDHGIGRPDPHRRHFAVRVFAEGMNRNEAFQVADDILFRSSVIDPGLVNRVSMPRSSVSAVRDVGQDMIVR